MPQRALQILMSCQRISAPASGPRRVWVGRPRRASILLAVLVVVTIAALVGTSATYLAQAGLQTTSVSLRSVQARALAWSGVQAAMAELSQQREAILNGHPPRLTAEWELFEETSGRRAIVRLVANPAGEVASSELAKLDINIATPEILTGLEIDERLISAIVEAREQRAFGSAAELLHVEGFTPELLFGEGWDEPASSVGGQPDLLNAAPAALIDKLTVFSFDPNVQIGMGPRSSNHAGRRRINLNMPWSERLGSAIEDRFGRGTGDLARGFMATGIEINSLGVLIRGAAMNNVDQQIWAILVDAFSVSDDLFIRGRIDLNTASAAVLECIPGITSEAAAEIVQMRERVDREARRSILWPLEQGILDAEEIAQAADFLTTRTMQWRIVVEGGYIAPGDRRSWRDLEDEELQERVVLEAVIDIASERPRIAYLRETTMLPVARALASALNPALDMGDEGGLDEYNEDRGWETSREAPEMTSAAEFAAGRGGELDFLRDLLPGRRNGGIPDVSILEQALQGPIETGATEVGESAGDQRIGRWTPGPSRKGNGS